MSWIDSSAGTCVGDSPGEWIVTDAYDEPVFIPAVDETDDEDQP